MKKDNYYTKHLREGKTGRGVIKQSQLSNLLRVEDLMNLRGFLIYAKDKKLVDAEVKKRFLSSHLAQILNYKKQEVVYYYAAAVARTKKMMLFP